MKPIWQVLTEQGADFDTENRENGEIAYKIKQHFTECYNGVPVRSYWEHTGTVIIADKSGKIIRFENKED